MAERRILGGARRAATLGTAWLMVVGASAVMTSGVAGALGTDAPDWVDDLGAGAVDLDEVPWEESESADPVESEGVPAMEFEFPEAGRRQVTLGADGDLAAAADEAAGAGPVEVAAAAGGFEGQTLTVEVFDRAVAEELGVSGFVFGVADVDGPGGDREAGFLETAAARDDEDVPVELLIDVSGIAGAYGGGFVDRLEVVALPDCVLDEPVPPGCNVRGAPLPSRVNLETLELTVEVDDLASDDDSDDSLVLNELDITDEAVAEVREHLGRPFGDADDDVTDARASPERVPVDEVATFGGSGVLFAVTSSVSGEGGTYGATDLGVTGSWQVSSGSGEFSYTVPIDVPAPAAGSAPSVELSYSSGSVDGMTNATNTQASQAGVGWSEFSGAFIERTYEPCRHTRGAVTIDSGDLCWDGYNATIALEGITGPLQALDGDLTIGGCDPTRVGRWSG